MAPHYHQDLTQLPETPNIVKMVQFLQFYDRTRDFQLSKEYIG